MIDALPPPAQLIAPSPVPAARFAPPLGTPIRYTVSETRTDPRGVQRFSSERRVIFAKAADGYRATVTLLRVPRDKGTKAPPVLQRGLAALVDRPVVMHLDAAGKVTSIEDREALWTAIVADTRAGLAAACGTSCKPEVRQLSAPLEAMAPAGQLSMIAGTLTTIFAPDTAPHGARAVQQTGRSGHRSIIMSGTETVERMIDGRLHMVRRVSGTVADTAAATMTIELTRDSDPRTGLIVAQAETTTITADGASVTILRSVAVDPLVS